MQRDEFAEDQAPAGHGRQAEAFSKYPAWHTQTTVDPFWTASEKGGHAWHADAPEGENRPEAHAWHSAAPPWSEKVLGLHEAHTPLLLAPSAVEKVPGSHRLQLPPVEGVEE